MWGKLSDDIIFTCGNCGRTINPYAEFGFMGMMPEQVFKSMPECPECHQREWQFGY